VVQALAAQGIDPQRNLFTPSTLLIALSERTTDADAREGSPMRTIVLLLLVVGVIGALAVVNNNRKQQAAPIPQPSAPVQRASPENVDLKVSWRKTSTNMMIAKIAVTNRNDHDVKDLDVECTMYAPGGTALGEARRTVYDVVPAKADRTFRDFNMGTIHGQANTARCNVIGLAR
jgi:hypothetical protein